MKWAAALIGVLAAIAGALYAVGYFLLPNVLEVTREATIERPRATVFAMINDLEIVQKWSPVTLRDPNVDYAVEGQTPGEGQSMSWSANDSRLGVGEMSILRSIANQRVDALLRLRRASFNSTMELRAEELPQGGRTQIRWRIGSVCRDGWINVPCRYMNLLLERSIGRDLESGLQELKEMAEDPSLPNIDFEGLAPEFRSLPPQPFLFVQANVSLVLGPTEAETPAKAVRVRGARVAEAIRMGRISADAALERYELIRTGPLMLIATESIENERISFRIGYPFSGPAPLVSTGVEVGETPSGRMMRVVHNGPRVLMPETYRRAYAYLRAHQIETRGLPWEVHLADSADPEGAVEVQIYIPIQ